MGIKGQKHGFTIIETTLVLSISGLLAVGILVGWSVNINRQRYNDSVNTFKSDIQRIFSDVENPSSERSKNVKCGDGKSFTIKEDASDPSGSGSPRGATNCIILGKMVFFNGSGDWAYGYTIHDVVGKDIDVSRACKGSCTSVIDALRATEFLVSVGGKEGVFPGQYEYKTLEWNSMVKPATTTSPASGLGNNGLMSALLIVRSPIDGKIIVFGFPLSAVQPDRTFNERIRRIAVNENRILSGNNTLDVCILPGNGDSSFFGSGVNKVVKIGSTPGSVEVATIDGSGSARCNNKGEIQYIR